MCVSFNDFLKGSILVSEVEKSHKGPNPLNTQVDGVSSVFSHEPKISFPTWPFESEVIYKIVMNV